MHKNILQCYVTTRRQLFSSIHRFGNIIHSDPQHCDKCGCIDVTDKPSRYLFGISIRPSSNYWNYFTITGRGIAHSLYTAVFWRWMSVHLNRSIHGNMIVACNSNLEWTPSWCTFEPRSLCAHNTARNHINLPIGHCSSSQRIWIERALSFKYIFKKAFNA